MFAGLAGSWHLSGFEPIANAADVNTYVGALSMFRISKSLLVGAFVLCIGAAQETKAEAGFRPVSSDELKMSAEPRAPGAAAIILYRQVDRDDNSFPAREEQYFRIKILTEEGRKYANIELPFVKEAQEVVKVRARTIRTDGSIVDFDGKLFEKELVKSRGLKILAKTFTLPNVEPGDVIEYFYTTNLGERMLFDSHWILSNELFTKQAQFSLKPYSSGKVVFSLRLSWHDLPPGAEPKQGTDHIVRMEASNIPSFQTEDFMPPPNELKSRVDFIYEQGVTPKDQDVFWKQVGKKWNDRMEEFIAKPKAMNQAVTGIISPSDSQDTKLRKLYDRVQQIRNKSYELKKSSEEEKRDKEKPAENVEDVWKRGYGNRTQLNWLFLALARAAGFETSGCWVSDRKEYFFDPVTRQSAKLDVNVVLVKLDGKDLYLAPGVAFTPFGLLTWGETGVRGLRLDKDGGSWIRTSVPQAADARVERTGKLKLLENGDLEGTVTVTYIGLEALNERVTERNADDIARKKSLERHVTSLIEAPAEAELINKPDWVSAEQPLIAQFNVKVAGWAASAGKRMVIPAVLFNAVDKNIFEHENRVHPVYFEYPHQRIEKVSIELPSGWQVSSVPPPQEKDSKMLKYNLSVQQSVGSVLLTRNLTIDALLVEQKYYPALRNFFQAVRTGDSTQIVLQPGELHASN